MKFTLQTPTAFQEIGKKPNQEDNICPSATELQISDRCFVLCDGMGGHEHGEVASKIVSTTLQPTLVESAGKPDIMTVERFNAALKHTYAELDKMPVDTGKRPGTTMTCLYLAENGAFVAHIGDSRVYQVRPGVGIQFKTWDHSLVNQLVKAGELTPEEAKTYPRRNVITRAMQPGLETPYKADTKILTDIKPGDVFFMCTDGILENVTDEKLLQFCSSAKNGEEILNAVYDECYDKTRDNFSCIVVVIKDIEGEPLPTPQPVEEKPTCGAAPTATTAKTAPQNAEPQNAQVAQKHENQIAKLALYKKWLIITSVIAAIAIAFAIFLFTSKDKEKNAESTKTENVKSKSENIEQSAGPENLSTNPPVNNDQGKGKDENKDEDEGKNVVKPVTLTSTGSASGGSSESQSKFKPSGSLDKSQTVSTALGDVNTIGKK